MYEINLVLCLFDILKITGNICVMVELLPCRLSLFRRLMHVVLSLWRHSRCRWIMEQLTLEIFIGISIWVSCWLKCWALVVLDVDMWSEDKWGASCLQIKVSVDVSIECPGLKDEADCNIYSAWRVVWSSSLCSSVTSLFAIYYCLQVNVSWVLFLEVCRWHIIILHCVFYRIIQMCDMVLTLLCHVSHSSWKSELSCLYFPCQLI